MTNKIRSILDIGGSDSSLMDDTFRRLKKSSIEQGYQSMSFEGEFGLAA
jgi:hypothetical protein